MTDEAGLTVFLYLTDVVEMEVIGLPRVTLDVCGDQVRVWIGRRTGSVMSFLVAAVVTACGHHCTTLSSSFEEKKYSAWVPKSQPVALRASQAWATGPLRWDLDILESRGPWRSSRSSWH